MPVSGAVTHVGLRDITFNHNALWNVSFGLAAPDGTLADLFAFADYDFYVWCGNDGSGNPTNCRLALAERQGVIVQIGHIERFNPVMRAMQRAAATGLEIIPRFIQVVRVSPIRPCFEAV